MIRGKNKQVGTPSALIMVFASEPIKVGGTSEVASKTSGTTVGSTVASDPAVVAASSAMKPSGTTVGSTVASDPAVVAASSAMPTTVMEPATVVASSPVFNSILLGPIRFNAERKPWTDNPVEFMG